MKLKIALAAVALTCAQQVLAVDATINFTGTILLPTCTVDSGSVTQNIPLGTAKTTDFAAVGATMNAKAFNINLTNCATATKVSMTVSGTSDTVASVLKNTGAATNVGIQLLKATASGDTTGTPIALNTLMAIGTVDGTLAMSIPMVAQFYRLGTMTAGSVVSTASVNFTYD